MKKSIVILGGCGGIGRALVEQLNELNFEPIVFDLEKSIKKHSVDCVCIPVDATEWQSIKDASNEIHSEVYGFVNLVGFMSDNVSLIDTKTETWNEVISGNLESVFLSAKALSGKIREGGSIVLTSSGLGHFARPGYGPYAIAKAGVSAIVRQLALELSPQIRVNAVAPAAVDTAFLRGGTGRSSENEPPRFDHEKYAEAIPLRRIAVPKDITGPIIFLLSEEASYITGQTIHVNGGSYMP